MAEHEMSVICAEGDTKYFWDPANSESVSEAQAVFTRYTTQGFRAARMSDGTQGEFIDAFDPAASAILFIPPIVGG